ncbi:MAG: hypothetical protein ACJAS3_000120 [Roseivirga sp.]|jgi:hypothetical protein
MRNEFTLLKKLSREILGIFSLKLMLLGSILIIQSCSEDVLPITNTPLNEFEAMLKTEQPKIPKFLNTSVGDRFYNNDRSSANAQVDQTEEIKAKEELSELSNSSLEFLSSFGFTQKELIEEFGSSESTDVIMTALAFLEIDSKTEYTSTINFSSVFFNQAKAPEGDFYDDMKHCLFDAFEIGAIAGIMRVGLSQAVKDMGKKAVLRIVARAAGRTLG